MAMTSAVAIINATKQEIPAQHLATKIRNSLIGSVVVIAGIILLAAVLYIWFTAVKANQPVSMILMIVALAVPVGIMLFGAIVISSEMAHTALKIIVAAVQDIFNTIRGQSVPNPAPPSNPNP